MDNKDFLMGKISRNSQIVQELENSTAWRLICEDYKKEIEKIDSTWHLVPSDKKDQLEELRVMKMALVQIVEMPENYRHDLLKAQEQLSKEAISPEYANAENYGDASA